MSTTSRAALPVWPVRRVRVEVVEGADRGKSVVCAEDRMNIGAADANDLVLSDPLVSRYHAEVAVTPGGLRVRDVGSTNGTFLGPARITEALVPPGTRLRLGDTTLVLQDGASALIELHEEERFGQLRGRSLPMRRAMAQLQKVAGSTASVLLVGESGTGKELAARAIHEASPSGQGPFEVVDCASLVPSLVASELFGHERGAFTGADRAHVGAFERAKGGTVFLDEIGELPAAIQANILGALERRRIRRLGGRTDIPVDARVVSATHRDLRADVNAGAFRLDLYYRLAVVVVELPPLRERREDLRLLVEHFLREAGADGTVETCLPSGFLDTLATHHFPGNVRELRNLVEAALATGESPIGSKDPESGTASTGDVVEAVLADPYRTAREKVLQHFELRYLQTLLARCGGNLSQAARVAGMDRSHLTDLVAKHRLRQR
jgi:DNA-binding NtrC family response regulator